MGAAPKRAAAPELIRITSIDEIIKYCLLWVVSTLLPALAAMASGGIFLYIILICVCLVVYVGQTLVRLEGAQELIVERLTKLGVFKNKSEVIRAGILELGKEFKVFKDAQELEDELAARKGMKIMAEIKAGKRKVFTEEEVKKKYGFK